MSEPILQATLAFRSFLFESVYENEVATAEFKKAEGILSGLWEKVRQRPQDFLDPRTVEAEGLDVAAQDFLAGMTDRYAVEPVRAALHPQTVGRSGLAGLEAGVDV